MIDLARTNSEAQRVIEEGFGAIIADLSLREDDEVLTPRAAGLLMIASSAFADLYDEVRPEVQDYAEYLVTEVQGKLLIMASLCVGMWSE